MRSIGKYALIFGIALCVFAGGGRVDAAARLSESKLSLHLIERFHSGAKAVVRAGPRVLKVLDPHAQSDMVEAMRAYKSRYPSGKVVVRVFTRLRFSADDDPALAAEQFWSDVLEPAVMSLSQEDRALIDYLEGPNEHDTFPAWQDPQTAAWFSSFWIRLADKMVEAGFLPCAGSIPVGNPPGSPEQIYAMLDAFAPALRHIQELGGAWSYHAYTPDGSTDIAQENWYSLRYRLFYQYFAEHHPDLANMPLILTEAGQDSGGGPVNGGWRANLSEEEYIAWLTWFDAEISRDDYVLGATLFQSGTQNWQSFETEPAVNLWLAKHLRRHRRNSPR